LWYGGPNAINNTIGYAKFFSHSHDAVIRVYDEARNVIETHEHKGEFKRWYERTCHKSNRRINVVLKLSQISLDKISARD
jgi:hypothetical protein